MYERLQRGLFSSNSKILFTIVLNCYIFFRDCWFGHVCFKRNSKPLLIAPNIFSIRLQQNSQLYFQDSSEQGPTSGFKRTLVVFAWIEFLECKVILLNSRQGLPFSLPYTGVLLWRVDAAHTKLQTKAIYERALEDMKLRLWILEVLDKFILSILFLCTVYKEYIKHKLICLLCF